MHSILFAIYAYSSHCISINVAQVACAWCMTDASLRSRLSLPYFFLSPSPLLLAVTSTCGWEQELPFSGMAGQLDLFLSCLVEINASDVLGTGGCHWLLQRRLWPLSPRGTQRRHYPFSSPSFATPSSSSHFCLPCSACFPFWHP